MSAPPRIKYLQAMTSSFVKFIALQHLTYYQIFNLPIYLPPNYLSTSLLPMDLTPPPVGELYTSHEKLVLAVNNHAGPQGYVVVTRAR